MAKRVYVSDYGTIKTAADPRLWPIPSSGAQRFVHWLAATGFAQLSAAWELEGNTPLEAASGWRPPKDWTRAEYNAYLVKKYRHRFKSGTGANKIIAYGRRLIAFQSAHSTGLAIDIGSHGLEPRSATMATQKKTKLYKWLVANAEKYGWTLYRHESWHVELPVSKELWLLEGPEGSVSN